MVNRLDKSQYCQKSKTPLNYLVADGYIMKYLLSKSKESIYLF